MSWLRHGQRAQQEYRAKNYPAFLENAEKAARAGPPRHPWPTLLRARAYSLNGKTAEAAALLGQLADMGLGVEAVGHEDFKPLRSAAGRAAPNEKIEAARAPDRVVRLFLSAEGRTAERSVVSESNPPALRAADDRRRRGRRTLLRRKHTDRPDGGGRPAPARREAHRLDSFAVEVKLVGAVRVRTSTG